MAREDPSWVAYFAKTDIHYRVPGMKDGVRVRRNLLAERDLGECVSFDLYQAILAQGASVAPVVVLSHGGPISLDWATTPRHGEHFSRSGSCSRHRFAR